jgi:hypothetical protein
MHVQGNEERWKELCQQASVEQDPKKLMKLIDEITRLLALKQRRLDDATGSKES